MSNLVNHARLELALVGEDQDVIDWYVRVIKEFASLGHSGGSAMATIPVLNALLQYQNLKPLTDFPGEWVDHGDISGAPLWQNKRCSQAFSQDGGKTYSLLDERDAVSSTEGLEPLPTPMHTSKPAKDVYPEGYVVTEFPDDDS